MKRGVRLRRRLNGLLVRFTGPRRIRMNGVTVVCPTIAGVTCEPSEPWMVDVLRIVLALKDGAFVDVGVNVGQTLVKLRALDPDRPYVGFEPNGFCVFYVRELIKRNHFRNCTLLPVGLFTEDGVRPMDVFYDYPADGTASLVAGFRGSQTVSSQMWVPTFRFESVADRLALDGVGIVKIDVEGGELEVLQGMSAMLAHDRPILLLEVLPVYSAENELRKSRQDELEGMLRTAGYSIFRVEKTSRDGYAGLARLEQIGIHSDLSRSDYVVAPDELADRLAPDITRPAR
jgi:FkbM family methyltransferase